MTAISREELARRLKRDAAGLGFDAIRIAPAVLPPETYERLAEFLTLGRHGEMDWMARRADERANPKTLWPDANSAIMVGVNYGPEDDPLEGLKRKSSGLISVYAQNKDYHDIIKKRLKRLARAFVEASGYAVKVFVDTAPLMEKPLAERAGIGWRGKHTNLVSTEFGSWLFLGAILTSAQLPIDDPQTDHCGSCRRCLDICPTDAFPAPYQLDARRCISYLTIELKGPIPREFRAAMGNRIYGCDDCLAVCPWNKFAERAGETAFHARERLKDPPLGELARLDDQGFRSLFAGSPIKRTGRDRFVRNVAIAIGNSGDRELAPSVYRLIADDSSLVRGAAVWALSRLAGAEEIERARGESAERDPSVVEEWDAAGAAGGA